MRNVLTLVFVCMTLLLSAQCQIKPATVGISNFGNFYRIQKTTNPVYTCYPAPDSTSLRITIICQATGNYQVTNMSMNQVLDYNFNGSVFIGVTTIWWKKISGIWYKIGQSSQPTICLFGLNPTDCFKKL